MTSEEGGGGATTEESPAEVPPSMPVGEEQTMATEMAAPVEAVPPVETRRTQLKVIRENVESLSRDVVKFRKNHAVSSKKLEKQVASLQRDFASLKRDIAKDAARTRAKQEKMLSRILAKVSSKPKKRSSK